MKLALALPPLLAISARSETCEKDSSGKLKKPDTPEKDWDVSCVTNMDAMFAGTYGNPNLFNGDVSAWDVSQVTNMELMFLYATKFNGDLSKWDVSKVTTMEGMFDSAAAFNSDLSAWDVSKVTIMKAMFSGHVLAAWYLSTGTSARGTCPPSRQWRVCFS